MDREQGLKHSPLANAVGIPLENVVASNYRPDSPLREVTIDTLDRPGPLLEDVTVHLDREHDLGTTRQRLTQWGIRGRIARRGRTASPISSAALPS